MSFQNFMSHIEFMKFCQITGPYCACMVDRQSFFLSENLERQKHAASMFELLVKSESFSLFVV